MIVGIGMIIRFTALLFLGEFVIDKLFTGGIWFIVGAALKKWKLPVRSE